MCPVTQRAAWLPPSIASKGSVPAIVLLNVLSGAIDVLLCLNGVLPNRSVKDIRNLDLGLCNIEHPEIMYRAGEKIAVRAGIERSQAVEPASRGSLELPW